MTTLSEKIDAFTTLVDNFAASLTVKLTSLNAATDTANAASLAANTAIADIGSTSLIITIYIDAVNGDDSQDGKTAAKAVKTWQAACAKIRTDSTVFINLLADIIIDYSVTLRNSPKFLGIYGKSADNSSAEVRKMTFVDSTNAGPYSGGLNLYSTTIISFNKINVELAYHTVVGPIRHLAGKLDVNFSHGNITYTGTGAEMFSATYSSHFHFYNSTIDASAAGHVIAGVAALADPNSRAGMTANFTSA